MSSYTTGEMAKLCDVSVRTVQFYDQKGILHPTTETDGGRRIYSDDDLIKLKTICVLKSIGLSLNSIKNVMESDLCENILAILLTEQVATINHEISERQKQLEMIDAIQTDIINQSSTPENSILDVEHIMNRKRQAQGRRKLAKFHIAVLLAAPLPLVLIGWLIMNQIWWAVFCFAGVFVLGIAVSLWVIKDIELVCPNCNHVFKPTMLKMFFSTGDHKMRWKKCPKCEEHNWCVMRKQYVDLS